jgi:PmbA protein
MQGHGVGHVTAALAGADGPALCAELIAQARARGADAVQVAHGTGEHFEISFENDAVTQLRSIANETIALMVVRDGKEGSASANGREPAAIEAALTTALAAADAGIADAANGVADAPSEPTSDFGPDACDRDGMLSAVLDCADELTERYPLIGNKHGAYSFLNGETCFANSRGVVQRSRRGYYVVGIGFVGKDDGATTSYNAMGALSFTPFERLLDAGAVRRAVEDTVRSLRPRAVPETFVGDVIITPAVLGSLVGTLAGALGGHALMAGTTPYKDRQGQRIADPAFSLLNRPQMFAGGAAFDGYGIPTRDLDVIRDGVLADYLTDFYMARKLGLAQTAGWTNFVVPSGDTPIDDIIAGTRRGVLLCGLSGVVPNANLDISGVAKNSFYVEDGAIQYALTETMVTFNLQDLLTQIRAIARESVDFGNTRMPYLAAGGVTISSKG